MKLKEYFALNANSIAIDPVLLYLRAAASLQQEAVPKIVNEMNEAAMAKGPFEITAKDIWKLVRQTTSKIKTDSSDQAINTMIDQFIKTMGKNGLLNYVPTPPGKTKL